MKEFIEKLIERLEELIDQYGKQSLAYNDINKTYEFVGKEQTAGLILEIVNELAEEYRPKTQADKIRSMSDEELAEFFNKFDSICGMCSKNIGCFTVDTDGCKNNILGWLQSEAE